MATIEELNKLYAQAKYREVIDAVENKNLDSKILEDEKKLLIKGWGHHQLGEYDKSTPIMEELRQRHEPSSQIGESAREGLAQGLLQWKGDLNDADKVMQEIPPSPRRDNARMNYFLQGARKGLKVPAGEVLSTITKNLSSVPYATINGHIINNGTLALHEARNQEGAKPYLALLPSLIFMAIGIYEATGAAKNHIAEAEFRASQICEAAGWKKNARICAETSVKLWRELVASQDGVRYQRNLEEAEAQLKKLTQ